MPDASPVVHVIDDDESLRGALCRLLGAAGFEARQYESAGEFLLSWAGDTPGCLLLDIRMPGPSGMDLQRALSQRADSPPVVFLTGYGDIPMSVLAIKRGAVDFLTKPIEREALLAAVKMAIERDLARREGHDRQQDLQHNYETLTARERQVFVQVAEGRLNKQIAASLNTCERTVKAHRAHVMQKLHVHSVAELVHLAVQLEAGSPPVPTSATEHVTATA
jgi:FixJ family two-component response regulator